MRSRIPSLFGLGLWLAAPAAYAVPTTVVHNDTPTCDILSVPQAVHELGEAPAFANFPTELISAAPATVTGTAACPATDGNNTPNAVVLITNLTTLAWSDLWYVGDPPDDTGGTPTLRNVDGIVNGGLAFKIDAVGINTPLIAESIAADGIFVPGEVWTFIIDDYANSALLPADALDSIGVGSFSAGGQPSSGSIIALQQVPEPAALGLVAGYAAALALRRRNQR